MVVLIRHSSPLCRRRCPRLKGECSCGFNPVRTQNFEEFDEESPLKAAREVERVSWWWQELHSSARPRHPKAKLTQARILEEANEFVSAHGVAIFRQGDAVTAGSLEYVVRQRWLVSRS